ncbi:uncharacterized protein PAC_06779 [Phialocephala subalpina]|uniref:2EXR domain-containing protein n=1 Tax=Phialocephala subalpina TaxID=576137 RepID=A0A1L7WVT2_9HELO|nr:uncharacterized protein PAC_06779 [Phialocephala subalpina]
MPSRLPSDIDAVVSDGNHTIFPSFPRLPIELRRKIWLLYLTDTESAPQIYRFDLRYPERVYYRNSIRHIHVYAGDQIFLQPSRCYGAQKDSGVLEPLRASSAIRQIASATCVEARLAVLELFPDTLKFRNLPQGWMEVKSGKKTIGSPDGVGFPEYILRFNSLKDIIVLHATWEDQNATIEISKLRGSPPAEFAKLSHVGVGVNDFRMYGLVSRIYWGCATLCRCQTIECNDHCKEDPLPGFLSLLPLLKTFYVTGVPRSGFYHPGGSLPGHQTPLGKRISCPCPTETTGHSWPMTSVWGACGRFAIYDEHSGCPFPKFKMIELIREDLRPHFPYYKALDHLDIKFIQLWDPSLSENPQACRSCTRRL